MKEILIGRSKEANELNDWISSDRSEFIAIYGRRRVGKTFLIRKTLGDRLSFHFSGSLNLTRQQQLINFGLSLREQSGNFTIKIPANWVEAFHLLRQYLESSNHHKKIIFLDELPWIDTPRSGFIGALENFWNDWAYWRDDIKLIVCGSATSWIISKIIRNKGGLHNRLTHKMIVNPFDLKSCKEYFDVYGFNYTNIQVAEIYMCMGGIPYYFSLMKRHYSMPQNIDYLFFSEDAPLKNEFKELYRALFKNYQQYVDVIRALAGKGMGLTRKEILNTTKLPDNGEFSKILEDLELCGFIRSYQPFTKDFSKRKTVKRVSSSTLYQLIDFYSLFHLRFGSQGAKQDVEFWNKNYNSPMINTWRGLTFEMLVLYHTHQIKRALGISDVSSQVCSWMGHNEETKVQIDLLINRSDHTINLCEMKFSFGEFTIDKEEAQSMQRKIEIFRHTTNTRKNILVTYITTYGVKANMYSYIAQRQVVLDDLFI